VEQQHSGPNVLAAHISSTQDSVLPSPKLITLELHAEGISKPLRALVDTGASNNFVRAQTLSEHSIAPTMASLTSPPLLVRLADGTTLNVPKQTISLSLSGFSGEDTFLVMNLDERFDLILGMPWLIRHNPQVDWPSQSLSFPHPSDECALTPTVEEQVYWTGASIVEVNHQPPTEAQTDTVCDGPADPVIRSLSAAPIPLSNRFSALPTFDDESPPMADSTITLSGTQTVRSQSQSTHSSLRRSQRPSSQHQPRRSSPDQAQTYETISTLVHGVNGQAIQAIQVENPPSAVEDLCSLPEFDYKTFLHQLKRGAIEQICCIVATD